jgi:hypothetical protein
MALSWSEAAHDDHEQLRDKLIGQVQERPFSYLDLNEEYQCDREICLATLAAVACHCTDEYEEYELLDMVDSIFCRTPDFSDHKPAFLRFVQKGDKFYMDLYMAYYEEDIIGDLEFVMEAVEHDGFAVFFKRLPLELRTDYELLKLALEAVANTHLNTFIQAVPMEALEEHEFILSQVLDRDASIAPQHVPPSFWQNREFIDKWMDKGGRVLISTIPKDSATTENYVSLSTRGIRFSVHAVLMKLLSGFQSHFSLTRTLFYNV